MDELLAGGTTAGGHRRRAGGAEGAAWSPRDSPARWCWAGIRCWRSTANSSANAPTWTRRATCCGDCAGKTHLLVGAPAWRGMAACSGGMSATPHDHARLSATAFWTPIWPRKARSCLSGVGCYHFEGRARSFSIRSKATISPSWDCRCCRSWRQLRRQGRDCVMSLTGAAKIAGIIGWPVAHSLSPRAARLLAGRTSASTARWCRWRCGREDFAAVVDGLRRPALRASMSPCRTRKRPSRCAMTAMRRRGRPARSICWSFMTMAGSKAATPMRRAWRESCAKSSARAALRGKSAVLLGAGGAARGAVLALDDLGAARNPHPQSQPQPRRPAGRRAWRRR